jgi:DNA-binding response OmpR family regulator
MRALIVEDDAEIARLVAQNLEREGFTTTHCAHAAGALREGAAGPFDIILLDRMLPDGDGLTICRELRRCGSVAPILMMTARSEIRDRVEGLETGADDYLVKPFAVDELLARVNALVRRSQGFAQLKIGDLEVDRLRRTVLADGRPLDLTGREYALLMHLAQHRGRVIPRTELLAHVWSTQFDPGSNTVEVHISRLRDKLGPRAWMVDTVRGKGYRLRETPPGP